MIHTRYQHVNSNMRHITTASFNNKNKTERIKTNQNWSLVVTIMRNDLTDELGIKPIKTKYS